MQQTQQTKQNPVLFLDIDGVLNIEAGDTPTYMTTGRHMELHLIDIFNMFLDEYPIDIVISSSWRDDMEDLQRQLKKNGFRHWGRVIGATSYNFDTRGKVILEYLRKNNIENYIVLDDFPEAITCEPDIDQTRVVVTSRYTGLSEANILTMKWLLDDLVRQGM